MIDPSIEEASLDLLDNLAEIARHPELFTESAELELQELESSLTPEQITAQVFEMDDDSWQCGLA